MITDYHKQKTGAVIYLLGNKTTDHICTLQYATHYSFTECTVLVFCPIFKKGTKIYHTIYLYECNVLVSANPTMKIVESIWNMPHSDLDGALGVQYNFNGLSYSLLTPHPPPSKKRRKKEIGNHNLQYKIQVTVAPVSSNLTS